MPVMTDGEPQPSIPPEDQPLHANPQRRIPSWLWIFTPIAILIGATLIAGAILIRDDGSEEVIIPTNPNQSEVPGGGATPSTTSDSGPAAPANLLAAFLSYAQEVGLDQEAFQQCLFDSTLSLQINAHIQRGSALGVSGTPTFFVNNKRIVGAQPATIFAEVIERELSDQPQSVESYSESIQALAATEPPRFEIVSEPPDTSDAEFEGSRRAKVVIAEFSDFQCPFCRRWADEVLQLFRPSLGEDVALAFLHFPIIQIHPNAGNASAAAICAGRQGSFWEMHDLLFARQQEWQLLPN